MITEFINRESELGILNKKYRNREFEFIPIYGRRRVGKTEIILNFILDKKSIYFLATSGTQKENIEKFKSAAKNSIDLSFVQYDWEAIFKYIKENINERLVIIIDEFPYLLETEQGLSSIFQRIVDLYLKDSNFFLILCSSSLSMMYKEVLIYKAPLYGRRTGQLEINPLKFKDVIKFFKKPFEEIVFIYSICGGVPAYLKEFIENKTLIEIIAEKMLVRGSLLREEVPFLLREEFRDPKVYLSIMASISLGYRKLGSIINYCGFKDKTSITPYLHNLESLNYIKRELPITEKPRSKKGLYFINDNFFNFWLKMVRNNFEIIDKDIKIAIKKIKKELDPHVSFIFEDICKQFLWEKILIDFTKIGKQWGKIKNKPKGENTYEIDIVALNENTTEILFCECKWQNNVDVIKVINSLIEKANYVEWYNDKRKESYSIFAKSFKKKIKEFNGKKVYCYDLRDIERVLKKKL